MIIIDKSTGQNTDSSLPRAGWRGVGSREEWRRTANRQNGSFWNSGNIITLGSGGGCTTLCIH